MTYIKDVVDVCEKCGHIKQRPQPKLVTCKRCKTAWYTRLERPKQCAFCKHLRWDIEPSKKFNTLEEATEKGEIWKTVDGGNYHISSLGRLWSVSKTSIIDNKKLADKYYMIYHVLR